MKKRLTVTIEEALLDHIKQIAEDENRSTSNTIETLIEKGIEQKAK